jgi:hypothetical protein
MRSEKKVGMTLRGYDCKEWWGKGRDRRREGEWVGESV